MTDIERIQQALRVHREQQTVRNIADQRRYGRRDEDVQRNIGIAIGLAQAIRTITAMTETEDKG